MFKEGGLFWEGGVARLQCQRGYVKRVLWLCYPNSLKGVIEKKMGGNDEFHFAEGWQKVSACKMLHGEI